MNKLTKKEAKSLCLTPVVLTILLRLFLLLTNKLWNQLTKEKEIFNELGIKMAVRKGRECECVHAYIHGDMMGLMSGVWVILKLGFVYGFWFWKCFVVSQGKLGVHQFFSGAFPGKKRKRIFLLRIKFGGSEICKLETVLSCSFMVNKLAIFLQIHLCIFYSCYSRSICKGVFCGRGCCWSSLFCRLSSCSWPSTHACLEFRTTSIIQLMF